MTEPRSTHSERVDLMAELEASLDRVPRVRYSVEVDMAFSERTGEFVPGWIRVDCPTCGRTGSPLLSCLTKRLRSYWSWVGLSYSAPHTDYESRCPGCKTPYRFTTYAPQ